MRNLITYPATQEDFLRALKKMATHEKFYYRAKLIFKDIPDIIENNSVELTGFCPTHKLNISTNGRYLFSRSDSLTTGACQYCEYELGNRTSEPWTIHRVQRLLLKCNSSWSCVDWNPKLDETINMDSIVNLTCLYENQSGEKCIGPNGKFTQHTLRNIISLEQDPFHITCQGSLCDQRLKGKSIRIGEKKMQKILDQRNSQYKIIANNAKTKDDEYKIRHCCCGIEIFIGGSYLRNYDPKCPYCNQRVGILRLANPEIDIPKLIDKISDGKVKIDFDFKYQKNFSSNTLFKATHYCSNNIETSISIIKKSKYHGCQKCKDIDEKAKKQALLQKWKEHANSFGLIVLNKIWPGAEIPLDIQCADCSHKFQRVAEKLTNSLSCPKCTSLVGESTGRDILSALFGVPFQHYRIVYEGRRRIYDGAPKCETPFLLFEYHGNQHGDQDHPLWNGKPDRFKRQQSSDEDKLNYAKQNDIPLLIVWHTDFFRTPIHKKVMFYIEKLTELGFKDLNPNVEIDYSDIYKRAKTYGKLKEIVSKLGGQFYTKPTGIQDSNWYKCNNPNHKPFPLTPARILYHKSWCPECTGRTPRLDIPLPKK